MLHPALLLALALPFPIHADLTYVDATSGPGGNTTLANGSPFSPPQNGTTGQDNNWELRSPFGASGTILESSGEGGAIPENAPELRTTLTGFTPDAPHVVFALFWDATGSTESWSLRAGFATNPGANPLYSAPDAIAALNSRPALTASSLTYDTAPTIFTEGNRVLYAAPLGTTASNNEGALAVFLDDMPTTTTVNQRTWYDGLAVIPVADLEPAADLDGDGLSNAAEQTAGTDPGLTDTDGDGFSDGAEVTAGSNPLDATSLPPGPGGAHTICDDGAWTWFNDERAIFHQGSLFAGYVKGDGRYGVTRYDPVTHESHEMILSTNSSRQQDDHNNPSLTVLPDGKIMALYAKHLGGAQFYQRTSLITLPSTDADWGPEIVHPLTDNNTYNNTYVLPAEGNRIYNFHRNINFNPTVTWSDDLGATWTSRQFVDVGTGNVRPYPRYCSNHVDRIDLIYTDGHPRDVDNSVYHLFYQGGNFHKTDGTVIDSFASLPLDHEGGERGNVIYQFSTAAWGVDEGPDDWIPNARGWTWDVHYGKDGHPVCVFQVQLGGDGGTYAGSRIYYYYARWTGTKWKKKFIAQAGRGIYSGESDYGGGMTIDPENPDVIYISTNAANPFALDDIANVPLRANNRYELFRGVTSDGGETFAWEQLTIDSAKDNLRPIVPEKHGYDRALVWFYGTYGSYTSFDTEVLVLLRNELKIEKLDLQNDQADLSWRSSPGKRYRIGGSTNLQSFPIDCATGILAQGPLTSHQFTLPAILQESAQGFLRVEESQ